MSFIFLNDYVTKLIENILWCTSIRTSFIRTISRKHDQNQSCGFTRITCFSESFDQKAKKIYLSVEIDLLLFIIASNNIYVLKKGEKYGTITNIDNITNYSLFL